MAAAADAPGVASMLQTRMNDMRMQKDEHLKNIRETDDELRKLFAKAPKKPRESVQELDKQIAALEFERTTSSLVLADERKILRQIALMERLKTQCMERQAHEELIQEKKAEINELRDSLSLIIASIDELNPVLAKVELAEKLNCAAGDLRTEKIQFPKEKAGHVIGKSGSNVKQIMERTNTTIDVDSDKGEIEITGSPSSIELAMKEICRITRAIEVQVPVSPAIVEYFTTRCLTAFSDFKEQHPDVFIDVHRDGTTIHLDGLAEDVDAAKEALLVLDVQQESKSLTSVEASVVVGKKGVNINKIVDDHKVTIDVRKSSEVEYTVRVTGPSANIESAMESINELLDINKDVTEHIAITPLVRNALLNDQGARVKVLQKNINEKTKDLGGSVFISIDKETPMADSSLLVKAKRPAIATALEMVEECINDIMSSALTFHVDPQILPRIIGKGGANIKEMKKLGNGVIIETDMKGTVQLLGADDDVQVVKMTIDKIIEENQVERMDIGEDPAVAKLMFRALIKDKGKDINANVSGMVLDEQSSQIILRGKTESIKTVSTTIKEFLEVNYIEDIEYAPEDEFALLAGGNDSAAMKMAKEHDAGITVFRSNHVVSARGRKENVLAVKKSINEFLHGGDGYTVVKIVVSEQAVGAVIGKAGSRRLELEQKHEGVKIAIKPSDGVITIRGRAEKVEKCRTEIVKIVSSVRVQESVPLTADQYAELSKPEVAKRLTTGIPVLVTVAEDSVMVRGVFSDVRDALALLQAHITGVYEARIELDSLQYEKVRGATRDPSHLNRMKESSDADIDLDPSSNSIILRGKRGNVKKAKLLVIGFLDFLLPSNFQHIKVEKVFQSTVANAAALADVAATSGASVSLDRDLNSIHIQSSDADKVNEAAKLVKSNISEAEKLVHVYHISQNEAWLILAIIGKGGAKINALSAASSCKIDVSQQALTVTVTGDDEEAVATARMSIDAVMDKARRECAFLQLPNNNAVSAFVGKNGAHIKKFSDDHGVEVERVRKEPSKFRITGQEENVAAAKEAAIEWVRGFEEKNGEVSLPVEKSMIPAIVGKEGAVINTMQKDSGCRIDIDRSSSIITVRGGTDQKRDEVIEKIKGIVVSEAQAFESEREKRNKMLAEERAEKTKVDNISTCVPEPAESISPDSRKDRASEFASRPIGLTTTEKAKSKKGKVPPTPAGTAAGRSLFGLLVSDSRYNANETIESVVRRDSRPGLVIASEEERDSSSVSSASQGNPAADDGKMYYKSASGFTVRI